MLGIHRDTKFDLIKIFWPKVESWIIFGGKECHTNGEILVDPWFHCWTLCVKAMLPYSYCTF